MLRIVCHMRRLVGRQEGASKVEYALMLALVTLTCMSATIGLGLAVEAVFAATSDTFAASSDPGGGAPKGGGGPPPGKGGGPPPGKGGGPPAGKGAP